MPGIKRWTLAAVATTAMLIAIHPRPARANPGNGNGAAIIREDGVCLVPGDPVGFPGPLALDVKDVETPNGNANFRCSGDVPDGYGTSRAVQLRGACVGPAGIGEGKITYSPGGNVSFECHIRN